MQIKTTLRYHHTTVRMAKIKNTNGNLCWRVCGGGGRLFHCWWECQLVQTLWKWVWSFLQKMRVSLLQDLAIPLLGIYPPKNAHPYNKDICSTLFLAAFFVIAITCKQPRCPSTEEWMKKMWYIYRLEYYSLEKIRGFSAYNSTAREPGKQDKTLGGGKALPGMMCQTLEVPIEGHTLPGKHRAHGLGT